MSKCINPELGRLAETDDTLDDAKRALLRDHLSNCTACRRKMGFLKLVTVISEDSPESPLAAHPSPDSLLAFLDAGERTLQEAEHTAVEEHLQSCPKCDELVGLLRTLVEERKDIEAPAGEREETDSAGDRAARLMPLIFESSEEHEERPYSRPWRRVVFTFLTAAAAVVLLLTGYHITHQAGTVPGLSDVRIENLSSTRSDPSLRFGDPFRLRCRAVDTCWIYTFTVDPKAGVLPDPPGIRGGAPVEAAKGEWFNIPAEDAFQGTGRPVDEDFLLLAVFEEPLDESALEAVWNLLRIKWDAKFRDEHQLNEALRSIPGVVRASLRIIKISYGE